MSNINYPVILASDGNTSVSISYRENLAANLKTDYNGEFEIPGLETDLEDEINALMFKNQDNFETSFLSRPFFSFDMAEPKTLALEFLYNYYVPDETEARDGTIGMESFAFSKSDILIQDKDLGFIGATAQHPRVVSINATGPAFDIYSEPSATINAMTPDEVLLNTNFEAANSNAYFTNFSLYDTDSNQKAYQGMLMNIFSENPSADANSSGQSADDMITTTGNDTLYGGSCKELIRNVMQQKATAPNYSSVDTNFNVKDILMNSSKFSNLDFSITANNLFWSDITKKATRLNNTVFASEHAAIEPIATSHTNNLINFRQTMGTTINVDELELSVNPIEQFEDEIAAGLESGGTHSIKHIGYVINKQERMQTGDVQNFKGMVILTSQNNLAVSDANVAYGSIYQYTVKSLYEVIAPLYMQGYDEDGYGFGKFLIASEGITDIVECVENIPPPPPAAIKGGIDFNYNVPKITWQFPVNPQRDIKRFQIFKRESVTLPFTLVAEYNFEDNPIRGIKEVAQSKNLTKMTYPKLIYTDYKYKQGTTPIYALASVDAHAMTSHLSTQISVKYNKYLNKAEVKLVSRSGAPKPYPNIFLEKDTFLDAIKVSDYDRMTVFFDPEAYIVKTTEANEVPDVNNPTHQENTSTNEYNLNLISSNPEQPSYKIHIINLDTIQDKIINIKIVDKHSKALTSNAEEGSLQRVADFDSETLSFT